MNEVRILRENEKGNTKIQRVYMQDKKITVSVKKILTELEKNEKSQ